jgi:hypothetical protein
VTLRAANPRIIRGTGPSCAILDRIVQFPDLIPILQVAIGPVISPQI